MTLKDWVRCFLEKQGRPKHPDGRSLYAYRMTDAEYAGLIDSLRFACSRFGLSVLAEGHLSTRWPMAFVVFAAEWWRREYKGGHWRWDDILRRIGASDDEWSPQQRSEAVLKGLHEWQREVRRSEHHRDFFGTIAMEGGLPQRCLAERTRYEELLRKVIRKLPSRQVMGYRGTDLVRAYKHILPQTFQHDEVYELLGSIAETVLRLRREHLPDQCSNPVSFLDEKKPDWRDDFPLNLTDEGAGLLLNGLIHEAAKADMSGKSSIAIGRYLIKKNGDFTVEARLELPDQSIAVDVVKRFLRDVGMDGALPPRIFSFLEMDSGRLRAAAFDRQGERYRIRKKKAVLKDERAADDIILALEDGKGTHLGRVIPPGGRILDEHMPWIFSDFSSETGSPGQLIGQGNVRIKDEFAIMALPAGAERDASNGDCENIGKVTRIGRSLWRFMGEMKIRCEGEVFFVKCNAPQTEAVEYETVGEEFEFPTSSRRCFRGWPIIRASHTDGRAGVVRDSELLWRGWGQGKSWQPMAEKPPGGLVELAVIDKKTKSRLFRRKLAVLPEKAKIRFRTGKDHLHGIICLENFGEIRAGVNTREISHHVDYSDDLIKIQLTAMNDLPPSQVPIDLLWDGMPDPIRILPPFPARGAHFFAGEKALNDGEEIYLDRLHGIHARIFYQGANGGNALLHAFIKLDRQVFFYGPPIEIEDYAEIRLIEYERELTRLFAIAGDLDSEIQLEIEIGGLIMANLSIRQYECRLERDEAQGNVALKQDTLSRLNIEHLCGMKLQALQLAHPECRPLDLEQSISAGAPTGEWSVAPLLKKADGAWLIYPAEDSVVKFRPIAWESNMDRLEFTGNSMQAACLTPRGERERMFDKVLVEMKSDPFHVGWEFLDRTIERLGHLPLASHDLVKRIVRHPDIMAGLYFLLEVNELERFESELPFMWERIPWQAWENGLQLLKQKTERNYDAKLTAMLISDKLAGMVEGFPAIRAGVEYLIEIYDRKQAGRVNEISYSHIMFRGQHSEIQKLMRDQADCDWPELFFQKIPDWIRHASRFSDEYLNIINMAQGYCDEHEEKYRRPVLFTPLLMGIEWVTGETIMKLPEGMSEERFLYNIRQLRAFHREWFDNAMNMTIGYGLSKLTNRDS